MEKVLKLINKEKVIGTSILIMLSLTLPQIFHLFGMAGATFLPMHIPVILAGYILGPWYGLFAGILSPMISTMLTGMPLIFPIMPIKIFELGTYGLTSGLLATRTKLNTVTSYILTIASGLLVYQIIFNLTGMFSIGSTSSALNAVSAFRTGMPGIILQIILIPTIVYFASKKGNKNV